METEGNPEIELLKELMAKPITTVLTLRDHFALAALAAMLQTPGGWSTDDGVNIDTSDDYAKGAYDFADAMVKARGVGT